MIVQPQGTHYSGLPAGERAIQVGAEYGPLVHVTNRSGRVVSILDDVRDVLSPLPTYTQRRIQLPRGVPSGEDPTTFGSVWDCEYVGGGSATSRYAHVFIARDSGASGNPGDQVALAAISTTNYNVHARALYAEVNVNTSDWVANGTAIEAAVRGTTRNSNRYNGADLYQVTSAVVAEGGSGGAGYTQGQGLHIGGGAAEALWDGITVAPEVIAPGGAVLNMWHMTPRYDRSPIIMPRESWLRWRSAANPAVSLDIVGSDAVDRAWFIGAAEARVYSPHAVVLQAGANLGLMFTADSIPYFPTPGQFSGGTPGTWKLRVRCSDGVVRYVALGETP